MTNRSPTNYEVAPSNPNLLTVPEACAYLRVSRWMFYRLIQSRELVTITIGNRRLVTRSDLDIYIQTQRQQEVA